MNENIQSYRQRMREILAEEYRNHKLPIYPADHLVGMRVPKGGSDCAKCDYLDQEKYCSNKSFQEWNGSSTIPGPINEYCCDFFETD